MRQPFTCVYREIWDEHSFYEMSEIGQLVYLFLLSCPQGNGVGCFKAGKAALAEDFRRSPKRFGEGFMEGLAKGLFEYDESTRIVLIPKYLERNPPSNPNGLVALAKDFIKIPDCELKAKCFHIIKSWVKTKSGTFGATFAKLYAEPLWERSGEPSGINTNSNSNSVSNSVSGSNTESTTEPRASAFDLFWKAYPNKKGKKAARRAFDKAKDKPEIQSLIAAIEKQKQSNQWKKNNGDFVPHPTTWLNQGNWDDETTVAQCGPVIPNNESPAERQHRKNLEVLEQIRIRDENNK